MTGLALIRIIVIRRVGGLEVQINSGQGFHQVIRRVGGLEVRPNEHLTYRIVIRRVGGLEVLVS